MFPGFQDDSDKIVITCNLNKIIYEHPVLQDLTVPSDNKNVVMKNYLVNQRSERFCDIPYAKNKDKVGIRKFMTDIRLDEGA